MNGFFSAKVQDGGTGLPFLEIIYPEVDVREARIAVDERCDNNGHEAFGWLAGRGGNQITGWSLVCMDSGASRKGFVLMVWGTWTRGC